MLQYPAILAALLFAVAAPGVRAAGNPSAPAAAEFFEKEIRPLLAARCFTCHGLSKSKGGLRLTDRAAVLEGGATGPAVVPGKPNDSLLIRAVRYQAKPRMPPKHKLPDHEIQALTRWVQMGLPWPTSAGVAATGPTFPITDAQKHFWSFQPVQHPPLPVVTNTAWPLTPIDRFILAKLDDKGLLPVPPAEKRTLIRRATFDLIGLPPTPEEVATFLADRSPDAFAKVIDRLLASPHYGERWGRHWLDVAHYADTAGETADFPVPAAYRYRNYVIDAFNHDKPYDQFLREQIAGDILAPHGPPDRYAEQVIATGYLAIARRFGFDPQHYHHLTLEDSIDTLGRSVLGLTLACARCHDHKFDPISRADYYALYGILASTRYPFPGSEEMKRSRDFVPLPPPAEATKRPGARAARPPVIEMAYAVAEGKPANARIQIRGDPLNLGPEVPRRFLQILGGQLLPPGTKGSGRWQLAQWLTDPHNPLTARVMVNRIWQHHFGAGIVRTPSNFGKQGEPPTHPELLDYLATRFIASGWSIKAMHRQIMLSRVYQLSSASAARNAERDPDNRWHWRFERRRLEAEAIRDALLAVSGNLDRSPGGAHPFPPESTWGFTQHNPFQAVYASRRRSAYLMVQRTRRHPFLALFDGADPNSSTAERSVTTVPTQALFFLNNPFVHEQADRFAERLLRAQKNDRARIELAYQMALGRPPTREEACSAQDYLLEYLHGLKDSGLPPAQHVPAAWASFARMLFSCNEFIYVD